MVNAAEGPVGDHRAWASPAAGRPGSDGNDSQEGQRRQRYRRRREPSGRRKGGRNLGGEQAARLERMRRCWLRSGGHSAQPLRTLRSEERNDFLEWRLQQ
ncbi:hypothetical protein WJX81_000441 [Elliptochloris bilobata]|uniref:Uncharacterized protein n=1 Tax=Elliptochloris bilobata TaxID=381761 RepID=A0AAW1QW64_9CHLO